MLVDLRIEILFVALIPWDYCIILKEKYVKPWSIFIIIVMSQDCRIHSRVGFIVIQVFRYEWICIRGYIVAPFMSISQTSIGDGRVSRSCPWRTHRWFLDGSRSMLPGLLSNLLDIYNESVTSLSYLTSGFLAKNLFSSTLLRRRFQSDWYWETSEVVHQKPA